MKKYLYIAIAALSILTVSSSAGSGPHYASPETQEIIDAMVAAHGGLDAWNSASVISFDNTMFNPFAGDGDNPWWYTHETIEQGSRKAVQDWPLNNATLVYDGEATWTTGWNMSNPPKFMVHFFYYFVGLPWLTQDSNTQLGAPEPGRLPGVDQDLVTITMTFSEAPSVGKTALDSFKLYIDPDSHLLRGYEYSIGYGAMLDLFGVPEGQVFGPMLRVHDDFAEVDGLTVPIRFHTMAADGSATYGYHILTNYSFSDSFDQDRLHRPADAIVDQSSAERAATG